MPNNYPNSPEDKLTEEAKALGSKLGEGTSELKEKVSEYGRKAADKIDQNLQSAAAGLDRAAATLHEKADNPPGVKTISGLTHSAADKLSETAEYVREHDVDTMMTDVKKVVRRNPGPSLLVAAVIGFLVGRAFTSNRVE